MPATKKYLDANGLTYFAQLLNNYPNNEVLGVVINAIEDALDEKVDISGLNLSLNNNVITLKYGNDILGSITLPVYDGGVS